MPHLRPAALVLVLAVVCPAVEPAPFADGDVVAFVGDSITHDGRWLRYVADYYATRFPTRRITWLNAGIAGDMAGGALERLDEDVLAGKPTVAVVMLGMNDVGRTLYAPGADPTQAPLRDERIATYRQRMDTLLGRLAGDGTRRLLVATPTPYEEAGRSAVAACLGVDAALARCAAILGEEAPHHGGALVDFHGPMHRLTVERQAQDPAFSLIGGDRVHPLSTGHLVMAWLFLKTQGVPALVSRLDLDAAARTATAQEAEASGLRWGGDAIEFTLAERALPFPINPDATAVLGWVPLEADLDREELAVTGLATGSWSLAIDDAEVGRYDAARLAAGINLALDPKTPQYRQAHAVLALDDERRQQQLILRDVALVEWKWLKPAKVDGSDAAATEAAIAAYLKAHPGAFQEKLAKTYRESAPLLADIRRRIADLDARCRAAAQPTPHRYRLARIAD